MILPPQAVIMEDVLKHKSSKFNGKATLDEVDAWIKESEKIFWVLVYTKDCNFGLDFLDNPYLKIWI